ncbi:MAG: DUF4199 domain-containing protein [Saprospiraceae bacterium]|nr:DUF4199 domain-containing protein [Saprospiraceae bacterium]
MTTLDQPASFPDPKAVSVFPTALRYGVLLGIIVIIYTFINYQTLFAISNIGGTISAFLLQIIIWFGIVTLAIRKHRDKDLGGYISMGRCIGLGVLMIVIATLMNSIFNYFYIAFINPDIVVQMAEKMTWLYEMIPNMDEDLIEATIEAAKIQKSLVCLSL